PAKNSKHIEWRERNRLNLARTLKMGEICLLLDEPTNDLDVDTLQNLEEGMKNDIVLLYLLFLTYRLVLGRVATHILAFEDDEMCWFEGKVLTDFQEYEADLKAADRGAEPKRP
ncbi:unnamed protein product, partial [Heterosigma akashiwo]